MLINITVKWLNGELQTVQVGSGIPVYRLIRKVTVEPLYRVTLFDEHTVLAHHHRFRGDAEVSILIQDPLPVAILVSCCNAGYYYSIYESLTEKSSFDREDMTRFEKVYIDHLSYGVYFNSVRQESLHLHLGISPVGHVTFQDLRLVVHTFLSRNFREEEGVVRWHDFQQSFGLLISENIINICFPTLTRELKRFGLLTASEWASYFAAKR